MPVEPTVPIGPYVDAEVPIPIVVTFRDSNQNPLDLTGYTAQWIMRRHPVSAGFPFAATDPAAVALTAVVHPNQTTNKGQVTYTWVAGDLGLWGDYEAYMAVTAGGSTPILYSQRYAFHVAPSIVEPAGVPPPDSSQMTTLQHLTTVQEASIGGRLTLSRDFVHSHRVATEAELVSGLDASLAETVYVTLTANRVMGAPINAVPGQRMKPVFTEGGAGNFSLTLPSAVAAPAWSLNLAAGGVTELPIEYNGANSKWVFASNPAPPIWGPAGYDVTSPQNPSGAALGLGKRTAFGASITSGQNILTITDGWFTAAMASGAWNVIVPDANDANKNALVTTVSGLTDAQHVTLAANAGATVAGGKAYLWPASGAGSDDGPSFIAAQAAAGAGGKVSVPSIGTSNFYPISSLSAFTKGQAMVGASQWGCALLHTGAGVFVQTVNFCQLQNLLLFAGSATTVIHRLLDGSYGDYQHVELDGEANVNTVMGLQPWNAVLNSGGDYYNRFVLINAHHCVRGLDLAVNSNGTPVVNVNTWIACQFSFNRDAGVYMGYAEGAEFWSCAAEQNGKVGSGPSSGFMGVALRLTTGAASDFRWLAGWIEGNKNGTIRWDAPVNDIEITGVINQYVSDGGGTGFLGFALGRNDLVIDSLGAASDMFAYDSRVKVTPIKAITYSAAMTPNTQDGEWQTIAVTNGTAFTINAPSNPPLNSTNRRLVIEVFNNSGGAMGVITWNGAFVFAGLVWANPATTKRRFVSFDYNGANWIATAMSTADY